VSSENKPLTQRCRNCAQELEPGAVVCRHCHALVHADELDRIADAAKALEAKREFRRAREEWLKALPLLPPDAAQALWIRDHVRELLVAALDPLTESPSSAKPKSRLTQKLGPLAPIAVILAKSKAVLLAVFKLKFLLSFASFIGVYWALWGMKFGIGVAVLILIHEMGHFIDVKRRGLPAEMPVFLPGLGAYVKWQALGVSLQTRAEVSLAGPLAGWLASVVCVAIWWKTADPFWASMARVGAFLNVLNLIPVWILDGGQAVAALGKMDRIWLLTAGLVLWLLLGEGIFFLVAAGAAFRLFTKDMPAQTSRVSLAYYLGVLACLAIILRIVPGHGIGGS
jgi:Zn-dependent protease